MTELESEDSILASKETMTIREHEMSMFLKKFAGNEDSLKKYMELVLYREFSSPIAFQPREKLRRIAIVLTTYCNLKCVWCHREEETIKKAKYLHREMDYNKLVKLLPTIKGFNTLAWGGLGEPMLYSKFFEVTKLARQYVPNVKTTSNGTSITPERVKKLADSGLNYLEVSIDGFDGEVNKKYRGADEAKIIDNLKYFSENTDIPLQINSVLSSVNYESLYYAVDQLKDVKNIVQLHSIPLFMTEHMIELGIKSVTPEKHRELLKYWHQKIDEYGLKWKVWPDTVETHFDPVIFMKKNFNICYTPYEDPMINIDGEIVPCGRLQHLGLDNVFKNGFDAAWNGKKMVKFRQAQLKGNYIYDCQRECNMKRKKNKKVTW